VIIMHICGMLLSRRCMSDGCSALPKRFFFNCHVCMFRPLQVSIDSIEDHGHTTMSVPVNGPRVYDALMSTVVKHFPTSSTTDTRFEQTLLSLSLTQQTSHFHTHTSLSHTQTPFSLTHTSLSLSLSLSPTHTQTHLSLSLSHTHTHISLFNLSHTHTHISLLSLSHTHLSLSLTHTHAPELKSPQVSRLSRRMRSSMSAMTKPGGIFRSCGRFLARNGALRVSHTS